jgi:hypothetical protein
MRSRAHLWVAVVAACAFVLPLGAAGAFTAGGSTVSCLDWSTRTTPVSTSTTTWTNVPGMVLTHTLALNFTVQVSATFTGANLRLRVLDATIGGTFPLAPGTPSFTPRPGIAESMSFTWVGTNPAEHSHTFQLQWRRHTTSPGTATMRSGAITLFYLGQPNPTNC